MSDQPALDQAKMEAFVHKVFGDTSAALTTTLAAIGDRLGLFKDLVASGPATSVELATRTGMHERYAREWLGGMASAGYLTYDPASQRFTLPAEHALLRRRREGGRGLREGRPHDDVMERHLFADAAGESLRRDLGARHLVLARQAQLVVEPTRFARYVP